MQFEWLANEQKQVEEKKEKKNSGYFSIQLALPIRVTLLRHVSKGRYSTLARFRFIVPFKLNQLEDNDLICLADSRFISSAWSKTLAIFEY